MLGGGRSRIMSIIVPPGQDPFDRESYLTAETLQEIERIKLNLSATLA